MINEDTALTQSILGAAFEVHTHLGSGMLESCYESCLEYELIGKGHRVERQKKLSVRYKTLIVPLAFRADLIVDDTVLIEVKSIASLSAVHTSQVLTYLRLADLSVGLLINFGALRLKQGIRRVLNHPSHPSSLR